MKQKHMLNTLEANKANTPVYTRVFDIQVKYIKTAQQHLKTVYPLHTTQKVHAKNLKCLAHTVNSITK